MDLKYLRNICIGKMVNNYRLKKVDILSPYLSDLFFTKLKKLKPQHVYITTDAGCSSATIKSVEKKLGKNLNHIKLAQCTGIVHGKCYLFHWKNKKTNRYKYLLLWGSCNATEGGFERNAEIYSWLQLSKIDKEQRSHIISYFSDLRNNDDDVEGIEIKINALTIKIPDIQFFKSESTTFDLWIQKGRLCHPFPNDPSFRHLRVVLKTKIAPDDRLSTELRKNNIGINQQTTIAYDYLRQSFDEIEEELDWGEEKEEELDWGEEEEGELDWGEEKEGELDWGEEEEEELEWEESDDNFTTTWKSRYCVDTVFGFWTSEDCFKKNGKKFHKRDTAHRKNEINQISKANSQQRDKWNEAFLSIIKSISDAIPNPDEYFHYKDGELDIKRYKKLFENQLNRDLIRSKDLWFRHGYISGYDFPEIPPMREFSSNWNEFITSFSNSLFFEVNKSGTRSWLAQTIRDRTDIGTADNSDDFLGMLRKKWTRNQKVIECFYCTEE